MNHPPAGVTYTLITDARYDLKELRAAQEELGAARESVQQATCWQLSSCGPDAAGQGLHVGSYPDNDATMTLKEAAYCSNQYFSVPSSVSEAGPFVSATLAERPLPPSPTPSPAALC